MTDRADFYILKSADARAREVFACRIAEKALERELRVLVLAQDEADLRAFDELLWTFSDGSFVPHRICSGAADHDPATPVHVALRAHAGIQADLAVNLAGHPPEALTGFGRIAEIIDNDENRRQAGRERFKIYRENHVVLETHKIDE